MARTWIVPAQVMDGGSAAVVSGTITGSASSLLTDRTSDAVSVTGGADANGVTGFDITLPSAMTVQFVALLSHTLKRNSWFALHVAENASDISTANALIATSGNSVVPCIAGHTTAYVDQFNSLDAWSVSGGASASVANRVVTLTQQVSSAREGLWFAQGDMPTGSTVMIDAVEMDGIEAGIGFGDRSTGVFDRIIRHSGASWEYLESPFSSVSRTSDAQWSPELECRISDDGTTFDFLAGGAVVFAGLPLTNRGFGIWTAQPTVSATAKWRLFQTLNGHLRDFAGKRQNGIGILVTPTAGSIVRISIDNNSGGAFAPYEVGRIMIGGVMDMPDADRTPGFGDAVDFGDSFTRTTESNISYRDRPAWRSIDFDMSWLDEDTYLRARDVLGRLERNRHLLLVHDPDTYQGIHTRMVYGALRNMRTRVTSSVRGNLFRGTTSLSIEEEP